MLTTAIILLCLGIFGYVFILLIKMIKTYIKKNENK
ncbi:CHASE3 domain sensor protein [Cytobacillus purgationiresistens]|uniref:CHASE3 domain sensor protein n=1 Tax=Cytobacillus purgationiresistens TaxID=863449 RepID=A0ABU0APF8_9BACI|nr:CHASE3 domain sensor protein [Cytobacillus purgationiresistens]